jgi:urea transport system ATP-binding protein
MTTSITNRKVNPRYRVTRKSSRPAGASILSVEALTVSFDGFTVLDSLDFTLGYGEMRFLIGPNGAGKTTLIDVITGKARPDRGG